MKKLILSFFTVVALCTISLPSIAGNTISTVDFDVRPDYQSKQIICDFWWSDNDSGNSITVIIAYGKQFGSYPNVDTLEAQYDHQGSVRYFIPSEACTEYIVSASFIDGNSNKKTTLSPRFVNTPGDKAPTVTSVVFGNQATFATLSVSVNGFCNEVYYEMTCYAQSSSFPLMQFTGYAGVTGTVSETFYGLNPLSNYEIKLRLFNFAGEYTMVYSTRTLSNLPPIAESTLASSITDTSVILNGFVDPQEVWTESRFELGETVNLGDKMDWIPTNVKGTYSFPVGQLKPGTSYFWRIVSKGKFGQDEGQIKVFKTGGVATGVGGSLFNEPFQISSCPAGIRMYSEKDAIVEIYSIAGQKVLTTNLRGGEAHIFSSLTPGMYIVKSLIEGYTVTKKALVN